MPENQNPVDMSGNTYGYRHTYVIELIILKEICKRCKKHKELAILKPRLCHDCAKAEDKKKQAV